MIDYEMAIYVNDIDFVPTRQQLLDIATIMQEVGIIDDSSRQELDQKIVEIFPKGDGIFEVQTDEDEVEIEYGITGPKKPPFFEQKEKTAFEIYGEECRFGDTLRLLQTNR